MVNIFCLLVKKEESRNSKIKDQITSRRRRHNNTFVRKLIEQDLTGEKVTTGILPR